MHSTMVGSYPNPHTPRRAEITLTAGHCGEKIPAASACRLLVERCLARANGTSAGATVRLNRSVHLLQPDSNHDSAGFPLPWNRVRAVRLRTAR